MHLYTLIFLAESALNSSKTETNWTNLYASEDMCILGKKGNKKSDKKMGH